MTSHEKKFLHMQLMFPFTVSRNAANPMKSVQGYSGWAGRQAGLMGEWPPKLRQTGHVTARNWLTQFPLGVGSLAPTPHKVVTCWVPVSFNRFQLVWRLHCNSYSLSGKLFSYLYCKKDEAQRGPIHPPLELWMCSLKHSLSSLRERKRSGMGAPCFSLLALSA